MKMHIAAIVDPSVAEATYHWRINTPFKFLSNYGNKTTLISNDEYMEFPTDLDILILPKIAVHPQDQDEAQELFQELREQNTYIIYDLDDDVFSEHFASYLAQLYWRSELEHGKQNRILEQILFDLDQRREACLWTALQCDTITVSTDILADYVRRVTGKPTFVVPNAIDTQAFQTQETDSFRHPFYKTIGWSGGAKPSRELQPMLEAWNQIAAQRNDVKFVIGGWVPNLDKYDNLVVDDNGNVLLYEWTSLSEYMLGMQVDIGCVCASDNPFSLRKSPIKAWEFALSGAMVVGSKHLYSIEPIVYCESTEDWVKVLTWYLDDDESRQNMQVSYTEYVQRHHSMSYNWFRWIATFEQVMLDGNKTVAV